MSMENKKKKIRPIHYLGLGLAYQLGHKRPINYLILNLIMHDDMLIIQFLTALPRLRLGSAAMLMYSLISPNRIKGNST